MMRSSSVIVFACKSKACAPPPVGTGGSAPAGAAPSEPVNKTPVSTAPKVLGMSTDDWAAAKLSRTSVMDEYAANAYKFINSSLRGMSVDEFMVSPSAQWIAKVEGPTRIRQIWERNNDLIGWMDKAFRSAHRLSRDTLLYRGMVIPNDQNGLIGQLKEGAVLTDRGFMSTSTYPDTAVGFTSRDQAAKDRGDVPVIFEIVAPKGTKVIAGEVLEKEAVLNRGTSLRIVSVSNPYPNSPEMVLVRAEVVDDQA